MTWLCPLSFPFSRPEFLQWELQRNYYKGVDRLEVLAVYGSDKIDWLKALGCFTEIIQHRTKVFIPVDNAVEIIDLLLTSTERLK